MSIWQLWGYIRSRAFVKNAAAFFTLLTLFVIFTPLQFGMSKYKLSADLIEFRESDLGVGV